jgi:lipid A 3-O-deacylase
VFTKKLTAMLLVSLSLFAREPYDHLQLGIGVFNIVRNEKQLQLQAEYRWDVHVKQLRPLVAAAITSKGSLYFCAGAGWDIFLGEKLVLTPSFAPGLYFKGNGKDLHFPLEFRSSIELAYVFDNKGRLGAQFYHISNASLAKKNPGAESLIFYYAIPFAHSSRRKSADSAK